MMTEHEAEFIAKACAGKRTYLSKRLAQTVANERNRGGGTGRQRHRGDRGKPGTLRRTHVADRRVHAYQCEFCNYWHLGSEDVR